MQQDEIIRDLLRRVRARWRPLQALQTLARAGLAVAAILAAALLAARWMDRTPVALSLLGLAVVALAALSVGWVLAPLRHRPEDREVARHIEERGPHLDDRLARAVDAVASKRDDGLFEPIVADAARQMRHADPATVMPAGHMRGAWFRAALVAVVLAGLAFLSTGPARQIFDAIVLSAFPGRVTLQVLPGDARVRPGAPLRIDARLVGNQAHMVAQVEMGEGDRWRTVDMRTDPDGRFRLRLDEVTTPFKYRVLAGAVTSPTYSVTLAVPPRVMRIDVDYVYPQTAGLKPRSEQDGGDSYGPAGTLARLHVHADRPVLKAGLTFGDGQVMNLDADGTSGFAGALTIKDNGSYRVTLVGPDGLASRGDAEYFIRTVEDRPPEARVTRPASDRPVTRLEEVQIEAEADDDRGIARLELVYAVRGGPEQVVPLRIAAGATRVKAAHTLSMEDLNVQPGDFVSYYVRARDTAPAARGHQARSDLYFLEVGPFEQELSVASSQASSGGSTSVDNLVAAQKQVVVATWKLDRREEAAGDARSEQDVRAVGSAESELRSRVVQTSSSLGESTLRDSSQRSAAPGSPRTGQPLSREDEMFGASSSMGTAIEALERLSTTAALPAEMEALNHLLKVQADLKPAK